ncbi:MAG: cytochrome c oxidase assembly protein [Gammaproteobacteria bacterium]|nr:cytochrome c oxidase assembly protein [Gammaproteobacteria bacterium]
MSTEQPRRVKHRKLAAGLLLLSVAMFGFGFALVPLYNALCRLTGLNGRGVESVAAAYAGEVDYNRSVLVQFVATTGSGLPFEFRPEVGSLRVHPGELHAANFYAANRSSTRIRAQAVVSYAPGRAARFVHKTECFCFQQENFAPGEVRHLPVKFYLDPSLPRDVQVVTVAYTYYNVSADGTRAEPSD